MSKRSWSEVAPDTEEVWHQLPIGVLEVIRPADAKVLAGQRAKVSPAVAEKIVEATVRSLGW
jgi:hypothetical protein